MNMIFVNDENFHWKWLSFQRKWFQWCHFNENYFIEDSFNENAYDRNDFNKHAFSEIDFNENDLNKNDFNQNLALLSAGLIGTEGESRGEPGGRGEAKGRGEGDLDWAPLAGVGEGEWRGEVAGVDRGLNSSIFQNSSLFNKH